MSVQKLGKKWQKYGKIDPLWTILTYEGKENNKWDEDEFFRTGRDEISKIMEFVKKLDHPLEKAKALDFGCGVGRLTQALAEEFDEVIGVDIAPSMIELAEKYNKCGKKCKYFVNDKADLKMFDDDTFDFIYTNIVLQHIEPKFTKKYIQEFIRILKPNGLLIFQQPSGKADATTLKGKIKKVITRVVPVSVLDFLFKLKYGQLRMDVFGIPKKEIFKIIEANNAKLISCNINENTGSNWISISYAVSK
jgi:ubiquinone/menaquinone biosynthesis C-methylase UbiE